MLTAKQKRFTEEYMLDHNGTAAAIRSGYAPRSANVIACRLLSHPAVINAVRTNEREIEAQLQMSKDKVIDGLLAAVEMAQTKADPGAIIAGWREIAKMCGYYAPERKKVDIGMDTKRVISRFEQMSDEELLNLIGLNENYMV